MLYCFMPHYVIITSFDVSLFLYLTFSFFFSIRVFFHGHWQLTGQQGKGGDHILFHSTTSTLSQTFRNVFGTYLHLFAREIAITYFYRNSCIYKTATRWDLPPYRVTIWLIDDVISIFVYLLVELILFRFCYSYLTWETGELELASTIILVLQALLLYYYCSALLLYDCCTVLMFHYLMLH